MDTRGLAHRAGERVFFDTIVHLSLFTGVFFILVSVCRAMSYGIARIVDRVRQPEYTGENRCTPCTIVNVVLATLISGGIAIVIATQYGPRPAAGSAIAFLVFSLGAIYVRGYLVPGTPTLTKRYFPDWLLAKFDKGPAPETADSLEREATDGDATETKPIDPESVLVDGGVLVPCADKDDLCLPDDLRERWREHVETVRSADRTPQVAAFVEQAVDAVELDSSEDADRIVVRADGHVVAHWESESALIADLAGARLLGAELSEWDELTLQARGQVVGGLRAFLETCPSCDGQIEIEGETVESCCRSYEVYAVTCNDCGARLLEISP